MKIVFVNPSLNFGGSERVIVLLANFLIKTGHDVTIITTDREEASFFQLDPIIKRIGVLKNLSRSKIIAPLRKVLGLYYLRQSILNEQADIVYSFQEMNSIFTLLSLLGKDVFTVIAIRNHPEYKRLSPFYSFGRKRLYKKAKKITVQTKDVGTWFQNQLGLSSIVIPNPVKQPNANSEKSDEKTIYACGRLVPQKGFSALLDIFTELKDASEWKLKILGDGKQKPLLEKQIKDLELDGKVTLEGAVENPSDYYSQGGVFAFTSDYEGFPNSLCEAMASGMAVVSYDCPSGPADLIEDGVNGFLVNSGDRETFKGRLEQLMGNEELRMNMGSEAKKINETLAIEKIAQQWVDLKE